VSAAIEIEDAVPAPAKKRFGKKAIIIAVAVFVLVLGGGGTAWFLLRAPAHEPVDASEGEAETVYVEVPALVVNLRSADGAARLIKLRVLLVPATPADGAVITARLPLVIDSFQPFLRELRPEDLAGSAAVFRIKEELLLRANDAAGKGKVKNVLIQDLIEQ
jgi:flagellar FliL protein